MIIIVIWRGGAPRSPSIIVTVNSVLAGVHRQVKYNKFHRSPTITNKLTALVVLNCLFAEFSIHSVIWLALQYEPFVLSNTLLSVLSAPLLPRLASRSTESTAGIIIQLVRYTIKRPVNVPVKHLKLTLATNYGKYA